ncbi:hypothetical protein [Carp edema virus]|nr:hypothetical protein [Carp edema virus]
MSSKPYQILKVKKSDDVKSVLAAYTEKITKQPTNSKKTLEEYSSDVFGSVVQILEDKLKQSEAETDVDGGKPKKKTTKARKVKVTKQNEETDVEDLDGGKPKRRGRSTKKVEEDVVAGARGRSKSRDTKGTTKKPTKVRFSEGSEKVLISKSDLEGYNRVVMTMQKKA